MDRVRILLSPVSPAPAFRHGEGNYQPGIGYRDTLHFSQWLNLTGFPSASVPITLSKEGLPLGGKSSVARSKTNSSSPSPEPSSTPAAPGNPLLRCTAKHLHKGVSSIFYLLTFLFRLLFRLPCQLWIRQAVFLALRSLFIQLSIQRLLRRRKFHARLFLSSQLCQNPSSQEVPALYVRVETQRRINHLQSRFQFSLFLIEF